MSPTEKLANRLDRLDLGLIALLIACPLAIYLQTRSYGPVNLDDDLVVGVASPVWRGFSLENVAWAFRATPGALWQPLVLISLMLDVSTYGGTHAGFHLTNTWLHAANVVLLFLLLRKATGDRWKPAFAALLWGVHPLRVESVAWITERKDVLSTFLGLLALLAYVRYARLSKRRWLAASWLAFLGSLMAKQMYVTLPCVLLLLDFWPLRRTPALPSDGKGADSRWVPNRSWGALLLEKVPFFALSVVFSVVTLTTERRGDAILTLEQISLPVRVGNALVSYAWYLGKTLWPTNLAAYYPHPGRDLSAAAVAGSAILLLAITRAAVWQLARRPYLATGWFWFLGTLVPVIGLVQAGAQARADRFTYLPHIGLIVALVWLLPSLLPGGGAARRLPAVLGGVAVVALVAASWRQARFWQDSLHLFERAVRVTENNHLAQNNLGTALLDAGRIDEAERHFHEALRSSGDRNLNARLNLAGLLERRGRREEAIREYMAICDEAPQNPRALTKLGAALLEQGRPEQARRVLGEALKVDPERVETRVSMANALVATGRLEESLPFFQDLVRVFPEDAALRIRFGNALHGLGRVDEAVAQYRVATEREPWNAGGHNNLGLALRDAGRLDEAVAAFQRAIDADRRSAMALNNLGTTQSMQGKPEAAQASFEKALRINPDYALVHANLGLLAMQREDWDRALRHFEEAVRLEPSFTQVQDLIRQVEARKP